MSADTSDPALAAAAAALFDNEDPAVWLVAGYAPGTTAIVLRATGGKPRFPGMREAIEATPEVAFAYVVVRDKGLVVIVLNGVGGVKRAKAIVHARAFAAIFPDYLALATLPVADDLTDDLIAERLGLPVDEVVEVEEATAIAAAPKATPEPPSPVPPPPQSIPPSISAVGAPFLPSSPTPPPPPPKSPDAPNSSSSTTPGPSSQAPARERDLPELPDDPTTPRAAVHPPITSVGAPVPQRPPRKRSASPPVSNGFEKATPARHSRSQPTSPYIPASEVMPSMVSQATSVPPTPPTPMTPVTPKAPIDPSAPQPLYQGIKPARAEVPEDATEHIVAKAERPNEGASAIPVAKRAAGAAAGIAAAAAAVLGVGSLATSPVATTNTLLSSPGASLNTPSSGALSNMSDSPRQRSVSNSSARLGSDTSSTRPLSRDSGYWGGRPPSRDASVPTSVTSDSRRSSRRGSDPSFSPTMLSRMSMYAPPVPPVPHELRRASREPLRGDPEPLRVASVPHSPMSSPLINSPHSHSSPRGSSGSRGHFMPVPLPVPDHSPPAVPAIPNPLPNPSSSPLAPSSAVASPPIPQRSRQRSIGTRALPPPSPVPDHPPPPVPNVPPLSSKLPVRPRRASRRLSSTNSAGPSPDLGGGSFTSPPLPPVPAAVREASLAIQDSGSSSLMSSPLVNSPPSSPRVSVEPVSPMSANSRIGSGAFFSARSSMVDGRQSTRDSGSRHDSTRESSRYESTRDSIRYDSGRDSLRQDSARNSRNRFDTARESTGPQSNKDDRERPISTMLPYAQPEPAEEKETSPSQGPSTGVFAAAAGATAGLVGLGFGSAADMSTPERALPHPDSQDTSPLSAPTPSQNKTLLSPNVMASVAAADTPSKGSPASSIRSGGSPVPPARLHKKSNSISRKPVPKVDAELLDTPDVVTKTPARKSSLRRVVETNVSPNTSPQFAQSAQLTRSLSVGGRTTAPIAPSPRGLGRSPSLGGKTELLAGPDSPTALIDPPPRDTSRTSTPRLSSSPVPRTTTPRLSPSPAFGTPPTATKALPIDGGMPQVLTSSVSPKPSSQSGSSTQSSPRVRASSLRSNRSPRMVSPAHLERAKTLAKAQKEMDYEGGDREVLTGAITERTVRGVDLSAVGSDVVGLPPHVAAIAPPNLSPERPWRPQTPQRDATFHDAASPRSILSSPHSGEGLEDGMEAIASAQVVTATPAHARVMSISNGLVQDVSPESVGSDASDRSRPFSSPPASPSRTRSTRSSDAARSKAASADGHAAEPPRGLGFGFLRDDADDRVERITTEDSPVLDTQETLPQTLPTLSPSANVNAVNLNSAGNTPVPAVSTTMPSPAEPATMTLESSTIQARDLPSAPTQATSYLTPTSAAATSIPSPGQLATPPSPRVVRRSPSKFRLFRSPRVAPEEEDMSPPLTPTSQRLRTQSITNAFRLRRNTNSHTPPGSPPVRNSVVSSNSTSEDHATLPYEYGLQGLGLANFPLAPSAYRTPSGGIGYTPAKMERKLSLTAQEAFASARERQAQEQAQALEAFRNSEKARTMSRGSSANPQSRVTSMAMSSEFMSDDSHYDNASDEMPQSLSLAMVTAAGSEKVVSPVEQLSAAASAARQHRQEAKDSPTSPTAGDEGAEARQRAREAAMAEQRDDEFHDAMSDLASDELELVVDDDDSFEDLERERLEREQAERDARAAQLIEAERLRAEELHVQQAERDAERARLIEAERVRQEQEALEAEQAAETRRLEKERLRLEAARMEEEAAELLAEENRIAEYARAEEEERRAQAERDAEADRLAQEARLAEMEARLEADRRRAEEEEAAAAAKREADRQEAERLEAERLAAERLEAEEAEAAAAKAEADRRARETREREEVTRQLETGKADGGIMLRGWVTVQTMNSPTWRRRYFHLLATELRLFKSDSEVDTAKPLTVATLDKAKVSEAYEESAVQGSWKLNAGGKEFYMFADTPDDRQTVLQGLNIAIGP